MKLFARAKPFHAGGRRPRVEVITDLELHGKNYNPRSPSANSSQFLDRRGAGGGIRNNLREHALPDGSRIYTEEYYSEFRNPQFSSLPPPNRPTMTRIYT